MISIKQGGYTATYESGSIKVFNSIETVHQETKELKNYTGVNSYLLQLLNKYIEE